MPAISRYCRDLEDLVLPALELFVCARGPAVASALLLPHELRWLRTAAPPTRPLRSSRPLGFMGAKGRSGANGASGGASAADESDGFGASSDGLAFGADAADAGFDGSFEADDDQTAGGGTGGPSTAGAETVEGRWARLKHKWGRPSPAIEELLKLVGLAKVTTMLW